MIERSLLCLTLFLSLSSGAHFAFINDVDVSAKLPMQVNSELESRSWDVTFNPHGHVQHSTAVLWHGSLARPGEILGVGTGACDWKG